jgi:hypothetical protein
MPDEPSRTLTASVAILQYRSARGTRDFARANLRNALEKSPPIVR